MIDFSRPVYVKESMSYIQQAVEQNHLCGDGSFTRKCTEWMEEHTGTERAMFTTSCTHAMELMALLMEIEPGDEVIMPSYTFASTADAFVLRGAKIVFADIRPDTMNIDENLIEQAITPRTKAIIVMHYAGVACEMDKIMEIARRHNLFVAEDAAQGMMASYKGKALGTIGDFGTYSFHETKNYTMGEGGVCLIQNREYIERAEIIREKGTDRSKFWRGEIDKYTWVDMGSSYLPSELNMAYLWGQLEIAEEINRERLSAWNRYYDGLSALAKQGMVTLPFVPEDCEHNAHMFYIKVRDEAERIKLIDFLKQRGVWAVFHYIPLHSTLAGKKFGRFSGEDRYTTKESLRLLRLPMYYGLKEEEIEFVIRAVYEFWG
ncbi:MAG: dTDP-4-amino-4,6-dideoxygalactose transaminase [Lachnospiraceae bacterium]|nr:dTDP-4-amino-4,6-dideoxygalactose transaminase [Lachnospiraceae bacterium]